MAEPLESIWDGFYDGLLNWKYEDKARRGLDQYWPACFDWLSHEHTIRWCLCDANFRENFVTINKHITL